MANPANRMRALINQYKTATKTRDDHVKFYMDDADPGVWWVLIHGITGNDNEFIGGEYLVKVEAPEDFPYAPPDFYFHTKNGVFDIQQTVCISIGKFHSNEFRPALGMRGFVTQLWNGLVGWKDLGHGIAIITTTIEEKKRFAKESRSCNARDYANIMAKINDSYEAYSAKWTDTNTAPPTDKK